MCVIGVEDDLSEAVARKLVSNFIRNDIDISVMKNRGYGYLQKNISSFIEISRIRPTLVLTDLDQRNCAPMLVQSWCGSLQMPPRFCLRVAEREVEAWLLADRHGIAKWLGVSPTVIPRAPDAEVDPKRTLVEIAKRGNREARRCIVPSRHSASSQGFEYNDFLCKFVASRWNIASAQTNSPSLSRAMAALAAKFTGMK